MVNPIPAAIKPNPIAPPNDLPITVGSNIILANLIFNLSAYFELINVSNPLLKDSPITGIFPIPLDTSPKKSLADFLASSHICACSDNLAVNVSAFLFIDLYSSFN